MVIDRVKAILTALFLFIYSAFFCFFFVVSIYFTVALVSSISKKHDPVQVLGLGIDIAWLLFIAYASLIYTAQFAASCKRRIMKYWGHYHSTKIAPASTCIEAQVAAVQNQHDQHNNNKLIDTGMVIFVISFWYLSCVGLVKCIYIVMDLVGSINNAHEPGQVVRMGIGVGWFLLSAFFFLFFCVAIPAGFVCSIIDYCGATKIAHALTFRDKGGEP